MKPVILTSGQTRLRWLPENILENPGTLYNIGNAVAIFAAASGSAMIAATHHTSAVTNIAASFLGSMPALLTTFASVVFWVSGMKYAAAWKHGFPPDRKANNDGHALSTFGALLIGLALMAFARSEVALALAIIATILHAGGKWGSWQSPDNDTYFKPMPFYSRVPYVTSLCLDMKLDWLRQDMATENLPHLILPLGLIYATFFWARADWLLLPKTS